MILIGQYANLRPGDPDRFAGSIAAVLEQYPEGLVLEAIDVRRGAARTIRFLGVADLVEWLDARKAHYEALAKWRAPVPRQEPDDATRAIASRALARLWVWLKQDREIRGPAPKWNA